MRKIIFAVIFIFCIFLNANAQSNGINKITILSESPKITDAKGYYHSPYQGLIQNNNLISSNKPTLLEYKYEKSKAEDNFNWIQFKKISLNGEIYFVLFVNFSWGYYSYPTIQEGWNIANKSYIYIYDTDNYNKVKTDKDKIVLEAISYNSVSKRDKKGIEAMSFECNQIQKYKDKPKYVTFPIVLNIEEDSSIVRFLLPNNRFSSHELMEKKYFEVNKSSFLKLFSL